MKEMCNIEWLLEAGGSLAGFLIGTLALNKAKRDLKKEIIDEEGRIIKKEIKERIEDEIDINKIRNEIKNDINENIVNDILEQNKKDMSDVKAILNKFENKLNNFEYQVMDYDKRIGKLVNGGIATIINNINKGEN